MMVFSAALLLAVATGGLAWHFLHLRELRAHVSQRLAAVPQDLTFPYNLNATDEPPPSPGITLEDSFKDKFTRKLYLAGLRSHKTVLFFQGLKIFCLAAPMIIFVIGSLSGLTAMTFVRAFVLGFGVYYVANFYVKTRRGKIERKITKVLPQVLDLLIVSVEAGLNFTAALPRVLNEMEQTDILTKEFRLMNHEYLGGLSFAQACQRMQQRNEVSDLSLILNAVVESDQTGASLANVLRIHAHELRDRYRQRMREKAHKLPIKLLFPMMLVFMTIFMIALGPSAYSLQKTYKESIQPEQQKKKAEQDKKNKQTNQSRRPS